MRVGTDLDGVAYDFDGAYRDWLIYRGYDPARLTPVQTWHFYREWGMSTEDFANEAHQATNAGKLFRRGYAYPGTRDALQRIVDEGHTLHVVTAREFGYPGVVEASTRLWVVDNLPPVESVTFSADKTIARIDVMIEDKLSNYDALEAAGTAVYLMDRPWNQATDRERVRVRSMDEFADAVLAAERELSHV
jgi:5'(3')-deoxyribonucleotidase